MVNKLLCRNCGHQLNRAADPGIVDGRDYGSVVREIYDALKHRRVRVWHASGHDECLYRGMCGCRKPEMRK